MKEIMGCASVQNGEIDRISALPDDLLTHILSFLSTQEAIQTCVLSKRWKNTWASEPVLEFNFDGFGVYDSDGGSHEVLRKSMARFHRFVNGVFENRGPLHLSRVGYKLRTVIKKLDTVSMKWLDRVVLLKPQIMHICISTFSSLDLPVSVFSCASLQHLTVFLCTISKTIIAPASFNLPFLKFLELRGVELYDDFAKKLFEGCSFLERLNLYYCNLYFSSISSNVLKNLTIVACHLKQMQISCPSLVKLFICSQHQWGGAGISLKNMISLVTADIRFIRFVGGGDNVSFTELLSGLSNATKLNLHFIRLNLKIMRQLKKDIYNCRTLKYLKNLKIRVSNMTFDLSLVACLLYHSPNLKELTLQLYAMKCTVEEEPGKEVLFQHGYLETVQICDRLFRKSSTELIETVMKTLDRYVKKIGNVIIV